MRLVLAFCAVVVFVVSAPVALAQSSTDADNVIMRLRTVCNFGQGGNLTVAFDIKARSGGSPKNVGAYSLIMSFNSTKLTYNGVAQMYNTNYWPGAPQFKNDAYGSSARFVQHYRGTGSALPLNSTYFSPSADCSNNLLNDGFFEILRFSFQVSPSANGTVNFGIYQPLTYRAGLQFQLGGEASGTFYSNLQNNSNDSTININNLLVPVELSAFTAVALPDGSAELAWTTESESQNQGFEIERGDGITFEKIAFVRGNGTMTSRSTYSYVDKNAAASATSGVVIYRLRQIDSDGTSAYSPLASASFAPPTIDLGANYPNPIQSGEMTAIPYGLAVPSTVTLAVYDLLGQRVATLADGEAHEAGRYEAVWNGRTDAGLTAPAGVYIVRFSAETGGDVLTRMRQITLVR